MINKNFLWLFLVFFPGCDFEPSRDFKGHWFDYKTSTYIIEHQCFYCLAVPTIQHIRIINERESIKIHVCEEHLASYILETLQINYVKDLE